MTIAKPQYAELAVLAQDLMQRACFKPRDYHISCTDNFNEFRTQMCRAGFRFLGSGYFAATFSHDAYPELAFKFGFKKEDSGAAYAAYCRGKWSEYEDESRSTDWDDVKHLPRIMHLDRYAGFYMVVMPLYESLENHKRHAFREWNGRVYNHAAMIVSAMQCTIDSATFDRAELADLSSFNEVRAAELQPFVDLYLPETLEKTIKSIRNHFRGVANMDLHDENYMKYTMDGQSWIVVTDPVSFSVEDEESAF